MGSPITLRGAIHSRERLQNRCCGLAAGVLAFVALFAASAVRANTPPRPPVIIEPAIDATSIDPGDVHMATAPFIDDDPGDLLFCSDWEIRSADGGSVIWDAPCVTGVLSVHIHLGDGTFQNAEGRLPGLSRFQVWVRFRDSSGDPATEWSDWSSRDFVTTAGSSVHPLEIVDVLSSPPPRFYDVRGSNVILPVGAAVALMSQQGDILLSFTEDGDGLVTKNPPPLPSHASVNVVVSSGPTDVSIPETNIEFADESSRRRTIYLPAITLASGIVTAFRIAEDGSSFEASAGSPDFSKLARNADTPWTLSDPAYRIEKVAGGLQLPVNLAFVPAPLPDADAPLLYITELYGTIRALLRDGTLRDYASGLLNFDPTGIFPGSGEQGIVGTVVDPSTGDLFVAVVYESESGLHYPKVIRIHSTDGGRSGTSVSTVLDLHGAEIGPSHQISNLSIGPDGALYVHLGDGFQTELAEDTNSFLGKILRVTLEGGAPPDNPFRDPSDGITAGDFVYARGFRNPFGGAWRAADASLYEVENGPSVDRLAKVRAGGDYAWAGSDDDMRVNAAYNWLPSVAPVNIAFIQKMTFGGSGFPAEMNDHAFVSESGPTWGAGTTPYGKRIREFTLDSAGNASSTRVFMEYAGTGYATVAALAAGPDGLYFSDLYPGAGSPIGHDANVYRIRYAGRAAIGVEMVDDVTRTIRFSSTITVPGYSNIQWDFGDGSYGNEANPVHTFAGDGPYDIRLAVTSAQGLIVDDFTRAKFRQATTAGLVGLYSDTRGESVSRSDPNIDIDWPVDAPAIAAETINVKWTGDITAFVSGRYTFELRSAGNGFLQINNETVIDTLPVQQGSPVNPIRLEAGERYRLRLEVGGVPMTGVTQLLWSVEGMPAEVVPSTAFYPIPERRRGVLP